MTLNAGTRLGPYEVQSAIGVGGMGEVYKATDTRLGRTVAIKVLKQALDSGLSASETAQRRQRFAREAKAVAALNHPHITFPFFSPAGEWVGFFANGSLRKVSVGGGMPLTVAEAPSPRGGSWNENGMIVFAAGSRAPLSMVSANGGTVEIVSELDTEYGETSHRQPMFLPGGDAIVFLAEGENRQGRIVVQSLESRERQVLVEGARSPRYSPTGHLLYEQAGAALAAPFDLDHLILTGPGVPILPEGATLLDVSDTGTLVYLATEHPSPPRRLVWVTRAGDETPLAVPSHNYWHPRLSPDGRRVAVDIDDGDDRNIWVHDIDRQGIRKLTTSGDNLWPVWSPDGAHVAYASSSPGAGWDVHWTRTDGAGADEVLWASELPEIPKSWSPDGQTLAVVLADPVTGQDIFFYTPDPAAIRPWLQTPEAELEPAISPDGQWVAYVSRDRDSGPFDVYVRPLVGTWQRQVSIGGGVGPVWSRDGHELYYWNRNRLYVVGVLDGDMFQFEAPVELFEAAYFRTNTAHAAYDVGPDGRFLMVTPSEPVPISQVDMVLNWQQELLERVPVQ